MTAMAMSPGNSAQELFLYGAASGLTESDRLDLVERALDRCLTRFELCPVQARIRDALTGPSLILTDAQRIQVLEWAVDTLPRPLRRDPVLVVRRYRALLVWLRVGVDPADVALRWAAMAQQVESLQVSGALRMTGGRGRVRRWRLRRALHAGSAPALMNDAEVLYRALAGTGSRWSDRHAPVNETAAATHKCGGGSDDLEIVIDDVEGGGDGADDTGGAIPGADHRA